MAQRTVDLLPKQLAFIQDRENAEILYSGCYRGGKSVALAWKLYVRASVPGSREGLIRKVGASLHRSTLKTLLEGEGDMPPVIPPSRIEKVNDTKQFVKLRDGGEILWFGMDNPEKIGSVSLTGAGIDEATELTEDDWNMITGRVSLNVGDLARQIYAACNPKGPDHFLAKRFGVGDHEALEGCRLITTEMRENAFLDPAYVKRQYETRTGVDFRRYVKGEWVGAEGLVYKAWNPELHVVEREADWQRTIIAVDDGWNTTAALRIREDEEGTLHVSDEIVLEGNATLSKVPRIAELWRVSDAEAVVVDDAAKTLIEQLKAEGVPARAAGKLKVMQGVAKVESRLLLNEGKPRLTVAPNCKRLVSEFSSYEINPATELPYKRDDHCLDALRYGVLQFDRRTTPALLTFGSDTAPRELRRSPLLWRNRIRQHSAWRF